MLEVLSDEEATRLKKESFLQLRKGTIFDLNIERFFIVQEVSNGKIYCIELDKQLIEPNFELEIKVFSYKDMDCINIRGQSYD